LTDVSIDAARELFDLNVWAVLSMIQAFMPLLLKSSRGGMMVNNTSVASMAGVPLQGIYNASKAAAASLTKTLRLELEPFWNQSGGYEDRRRQVGIFHANMNANVKEKTGTPLALPEGSLYEVAREEMEKILKGEAMGSRMVDPDQWAEKVVGDLTRKSPPATSVERRQCHSGVVRIKVFSGFPLGQVNEGRWRSGYCGKAVEGAAEAMKPLHSSNTVLNCESKSIQKTKMEARMVKRNTDRSPLSNVSPRQYSAGSGGDSQSSNRTLLLWIALPIGCHSRILQESSLPSTRPSDPVTD
jgi:hypothetical protein